MVQAQQSRLAGATVFQGYVGYGRSSGLHMGKILHTSHDSARNLLASMPARTSITYTGPADSKFVVSLLAYFIIKVPFWPCRGNLNQ